MKAKRGGVERLLDIVAPKFSEIDIFSIVFLVFLALVESRVFVWAWVQRFDPPNLDSTNLFGWVFLVLVVGFVLYVTIKHLVKKEHWKLEEIRSVAIYFYLLLGIASIYLLNQQANVVNLWSVFVQLFLLGRSVLMIIVVVLIANVREKLYVGRMSTDQAQFMEVVAMVLFGTIIYFVLRQNHGILAAITYSYFYLSTLLGIISSVFNIRIAKR